jgi:hypothetical protein
VSGPAKTLTEVLADLGYTHGPRGSESLSGRVVLRDGKPAWEGSAEACWAWLRESGQLAAGASA